MSLALACLYTLQGIPCLYYGTEQGLAGAGDDREHVRECLWRDASVFDRTPPHPLYRTVHALAELRRQHPALRYGRQYQRQLTGNGVDFDYSPYAGGVLAYSRILNDTELVIAANTSQEHHVEVKVVVDRHLHAPGGTSHILFTNRPSPEPTPPAASELLAGRAVITVTLSPMEVQVLG